MEVRNKAGIRNDSPVERVFRASLSRELRLYANFSGLISIMNI